MGSENEQKKEEKKDVGSAEKISMRGMRKSRRFKGRSCHLIVGKISSLHLRRQNRCKGER